MQIALISFKKLQMPMESTQSWAFYRNKHLDPVFGTSPSVRTANFLLNDISEVSLGSLLEIRPTLFLACYDSSLVPPKKMVFPRRKVKTTVSTQKKGTKQHGAAVTVWFLQKQIYVNLSHTQLSEGKKCKGYIQLLFSLGQIAKASGH